MSSPQLRIAIVGGGPAGLTLGLLLHKHGIPSTIFELQQLPTDEELARPSGSFDLHEDSGLAAIKECGLYDEFTTLLDDCTEEWRIVNKHGHVVYEDGGETGGRPEISRHKLTKLLLSHLPPGMIKWGHKLITARSSIDAGQAQIELDFGSNGKQTFDLAIGADGAWSKIRNLLTDVKPQYTGIQNVTINIRQITTRFPHLAKLVGSGTFSALGSGNGIVSQRSSQQAARMYCLIKTEDEQFKYTQEFDDKTAAQIKERLVSDDLFFGQWNANIKELIATGCDDETVHSPGDYVNIKPLYRLPVGHSWPHKQGATIVGDAAHLMEPWAGQGVNLAMKDSLQLSHAIIKAYDPVISITPSSRKILDQSIQAFEEKMIAEATFPAQITLDNGERMFGREDGATALGEFMKSMGPPPEAIHLDG